MALDDARPPQDPPPLAPPRAGFPAEFLFLLIVGSLTLLFGMAGVPGLPEPTAGDGSDALRKGWAERRLAESLAAAEGEPQRPAEAPLAPER